MNPEAQRFAHDMDAAHYWRQFTPRVSFDEPGDEVVGLVEDLLEERTPNGVYPRLKVRLRDGVAVYVLATQARLLAELIEARPRVGDLIKITYQGEAAKAVAGLNKTKLFTVRVKRAETPAGSGGGQPGGTPAAASPSEVAS